MPGFLSDIFGIPTETLEDYGALDVSLIADLPLFVDPFLLFNSDKNEYKQLHDDIVSYIKFLKRKSDAGDLSSGKLREWYCFAEVRQNWLGYCELGNGGSGLGPDFGKSLNESLSLLFGDFGEEKLTKGTHLEKVCLVRNGVGRDNISDFVTNLIKGYLLTYTQAFALEHIEPCRRKVVTVPRAKFNYTLEIWTSQRYTLPYYDRDYIILTPRDILTKDENWINQKDLIEKFEDIPRSIPNDQLRWQIENYFQNLLRADSDKQPNKQEKTEATLKTIMEYPWLVDIYIKIKEDNGDEAKSVAEERLQFAQIVFNSAVRRLSELLPNDFYVLPPVGSYEEAQRRLAYFKHVIEDQGGHRLFYVGDKPLRRVRWSPKTGQGFKVGSPLMKDGSDDWQTQALLG